MIRTVRQIKMAKIYVPKYYIEGDQGFCGSWVEETVYYEGVYTNKADMKARFAKAEAEWGKGKGAKVIFKEWWEILEILD